MTLLRRVHFPLLAPLVAAGLVVVLALALVPPAEAAADPPKKCRDKHYARQHPKACTEAKPRPKPEPVWSPGTATTFNYPFATAAKRNAIRHRVLKAVKYTPRGARIRLATFSYHDAKMTRALIRAHKRGVSVQLLVNRDGERLGRSYDKLQRALGDRRKPRHGMSPAEVSFARSCLRSCRGRRGNLHSKIFLFSQVGHTRWVSMVGSANLTRKAAIGQWNHMDTLVGEADVRAPGNAVQPDEGRPRAGAPDLEVPHGRRRVLGVPAPDRRPEPRPDGARAPPDQLPGDAAHRDPRTQGPGQDRKEEAGARLEGAPEDEARSRSRRPGRSRAAR